MALNIKNREAEQLAAEVAALAGETKTTAIAVALRERLERLRADESREERAAHVQRVLEEEIWPQVPASVRGKRISKMEREQILGYGPEGV
jgi:antitoxin VapB